jgi:hypothetical protein
MRGFDVLDDDAEAVVVLDHVLEVEKLVPRHDRECHRVRTHPLVFVEAHHDLIPAFQPPALADERRLRGRVVQLG